jgi:hypothetical protein
MDRQPFLDWRRFDIRLTQGHLPHISGLFHVTTEEAFPCILNEGLKAGIELTESGQCRVDIHMLIAPPYPNDVLNNRRINKMRSKGYQSVVVLSVKMDALNLDQARINCHGVVLQRTGIPPNMIDCALKVTNMDDQVQCEWLFASDVNLLSNCSGNLTANIAILRCITCNTSISQTGNKCATLSNSCTIAT